MKPDFILVEGRAFNWRQLCELRKQQLETWRAAQGRQLALFELMEDCRPAAERSAAGRYEEPTLMEWLVSDAGSERS
jgi:hypothetical protein